MQINGTEFTFVRPTIYFIKKIARGEMEKIGEKFAAGILNDEELKKFNIQWKVFCSTIFERSLLWKCGLYPKELKLENVSINDVLRVIRDFFDLLGETLQELKVQQKPSSVSVAQSSKIPTPSQEVMS